MLFEPVIAGKPSTKVLFTRVLHVPVLQNNLLSVLYLATQKDFKIEINKERFEFIKNGTLVLTVLITKNIGLLDSKTIPNPEYALATTVDRPLLHQHLCHIGKDCLERLIKDMDIKGTKIDKATPLPNICEPCIAGKQHHDPFPKSTENCSTEPLQLVVSDLHGKVQTRTSTGFEYWMTFIDDFSCHTTVILLKKKSDAFSAFLTYKAMMENQTGRKLKRFRDNKGGKYIGKD